jgi:hypothetical protein
MQFRVYEQCQCVKAECACSDYTMRQSSVVMWFQSTLEANPLFERDL